MQIHKAVLSHLSTRILNVPLLIESTKLETILGVIGPRIGVETQLIDVPVLEEGQEATRKTPAATPGIEVIPIRGTLVYRTQGLQSMSGIQSYESVRQDFKEALANPAVSAILFDFDSNGGEVAGVHDLIDEIYTARGTKPIYAYANEVAYSAAYGLASAADEIFIPRTGGVGSVGVVAVHVDASGANEKKGYKYTPIYAGARKVDFSHYQPLSDQARDIVQKEIDQVYDLFTETVARNRKNRMSAKQVKDTEAGIYMGNDAVEIGFADHVMSWDAAINYIDQQIKKRRSKPMNSEQAIEQIQAILNQDGVEMAKVLSGCGYVPQADIEKIQSKALVDEEAAAEALAAANTLSQRIKEVADICLLAGTPEKIKEYLDNDKMSIEDIRKAIMDAKARASQEIRSTVGAISTGESSPLIANAEKRAGKAKKEAA